MSDAQGGPKVSSLAGFALALAVFVATGASPTLAATTYVSGAMCTEAVAENPNPNPLLHNEQGAVITGMAGINWTLVVCPLPSWNSTASNGQTNAQVSVDAATLVFIEGSAQNGGVITPFWCWLSMEDWNGVVYHSSALFSCEGTAGCSSRDQHTSPLHGQLNWTAPIYWEGNPPAAVYPTQIAVTCLMPPKGATIRGYNFTTTVTP